MHYSKNSVTRRNKPRCYSVQLENFSLHIMKESLFWTFQNNPNLNQTDTFSMFASAANLRDFQSSQILLNLSTSVILNLCYNDQNR